MLPEVPRLPLASPITSGVHPGAAPLLGIDLVAVSEVARSVDRFGERYLQRVFTGGELAYCLSCDGEPAAHLAARFAAKEATFKALGGGDEPLDWRSIEVVRRPDGSCSLVLHGSMQHLAHRRAVRRLKLSMSHDGAYAIAVVVGDEYGQTRPPSRIARKAPRRLQRR